MRDFVCGVTGMELLGCSHDDMEGGQAFVRMDKLESDESKRRNLGSIIVFKDAIQSTLPNLRCWLVSPCDFGIIRVRSPADLVSLGLTLEPESWKDSCTRKRSHLIKTHPLRDGLRHFNRWLQVVLQVATETAAQQLASWLLGVELKRQKYPLFWYWRGSLSL